MYLTTVGQKETRMNGTEEKNKHFNNKSWRLQ